MLTCKTDEETQHYASLSFSFSTAKFLTFYAYLIPFVCLNKNLPKPNLLSLCNKIKLILSLFLYFVPPQTSQLHHCYSEPLVVHVHLVFALCNFTCQRMPPFLQLCLIYTIPELERSQRNIVQKCLHNRVLHSKGYC